MTLLRKLPSLAVFTKNNLNPAYAGARLGAERTAARLGAEITHYVPNKPDDIAEQADLIEQALRQKPDAVIMVPVHPTAMNDRLEKFKTADIPVVAYINRFTAGDPITFVGSDDYPVAFGIATYLCQRLEGVGSVAILEGPAESITSRERMRGFHSALQQFPGIRLVATVCGDYLREPARREASILLKNHPRLDGIIAANDIMALGLVDALQSVSHRPLIVGINAIPEAVSAIRDGHMLATADFNAMHMGCLATEAAIRHLRGETLPKEILVPVQIVGRANCVNWDIPYQERALPNWHDVVRA